MDSSWQTVTEKIVDASISSIFIPEKSIITYIRINFHVPSFNEQTSPANQHYTDLHIAMKAGTKGTNQGPPIEEADKQIKKTLFLAQDKDNGSYEFSGQLYTGVSGCCIGCTHNGAKDGIGRFMVSYYVV
jgi:hypothetical protein